MRHHGREHRSEAVRGGPTRALIRYVLQAAVGLILFFVFFNLWWGLGLPLEQHAGTDLGYFGVKALLVASGLFILGQALAYKMFKKSAKASEASSSQ